MEIMKQMAKAREAFRTAEKEMDIYINDAIKEIVPDGVMCTPHYTRENLLISVHPLGECGPETKMTINDIDFCITCDVDLNLLKKVADLIIGADAILGNW